MAKNVRPYNAAEAAGDFPWDLYEDGWNGKSLKSNNKVKIHKTKVKTSTGKTSYKNMNHDIVYSHDDYAQKLYNAYSQIKTESKELKKNSLVSISDIIPINDDTALITINNGVNNIVVDLNKEQKFFNLFSVGDKPMTKQTFNQYIKTPEFKKTIIDMNLYAKVGTDVEKASIWDGYVERLAREMRESITKNNVAYQARIISNNVGGFIVEVADTIKAFMRGSMAAANRITDFESYVGKTMEVMVEYWDPNIGFIVSRKKYLTTILPKKINELTEILKKNQDTEFIGHITGSTDFGIFVELDEFITGMLHKTLVRDETREAMRNGTIKPGDEIKVYVHKIDGTRVILSDVPSSERDAVIARREAEDMEEKRLANAENAEAESNGVEESEKKVSE